MIDRALALPQEIPVRELPARQRIFVLPVDDRLSVLLVELTEQTPLTEETYATYAALGLVQAPLLAEELGAGDRTEEAFGFDALAGRHQFRFTGASDAPTTTQPDTVASFNSPQIPPGPSDPG